MTRTEAETAYKQAFRTYATAKAELRDAEQRIIEARGITLPYQGPMKTKVRHHENRLIELQATALREVQT